MFTISVFLFLMFFETGHKLHLWLCTSTHPDPNTHTAWERDTKDKLQICCI